jgi:hypothetical protein
MKGLEKQLVEVPKVVHGARDLEALFGPEEQ